MHIQHKVYTLYCKEHPVRLVGFDHCSAYTVKRLTCIEQSHQLWLHHACVGVFMPKIMLITHDNLVLTTLPERMLMHELYILNCPLLLHMMKVIVPHLTRNVTLVLLFSLLQTVCLLRSKPSLHVFLKYSKYLHITMIVGSNFNPNNTYHCTIITKLNNGEIRFRKKESLFIPVRNCHVV